MGPEDSLKLRLVSASSNNIQWFTRHQQVEGGATRGQSSNQVDDIATEFLLQFKSNFSYIHSNKLKSYKKKTFQKLNDNIFSKDND